MVNGKRLAEWAKKQIGRSYEDVDCKGLIVEGIRTLGTTSEEKKYCCAGTNELWRSLNASGKYRYITSRTPIKEAKAKGMLLPGAILAIHTEGYNTKYEDWEGDCSHVAIYIGDDEYEVIQSSATRKMVCGTKVANGFTHVLEHRLISLSGAEHTADDEQETADDDAQTLDYTPLESPYAAIVCTQKDPLTIRDKPSAKGNAIGKVKKGGYMTVVGMVKVDDTGRAWLPVEAQPDNRRTMTRGWAAAEYLTPVEEESTPLAQTASVIIDNVIVPRETVLALADAVNVLHGAAAYNATDYLHGVNALIGAAEAVTACLKGDD